MMLLQVRLVPKFACPTTTNNSNHKCHLLPNCAATDRQCRWWLAVVGGPPHLLPLTGNSRWWLVDPHTCCH